MPEIRIPGSDDHRDSHPSPRCGRLDPHEPHEWSISPKRTYLCPGPPRITRAEREAVEKSVRKARGESDG